ncbi:hypothetical protein BO71DRAFT_179577 [Aspergillus ellipticus CBS 707.79]|uniref:Uncharacterized protein n=1 Tax=Aspergillus ellipticus CBS 707.79 TaxID=1448320 RepID=A0A319CQN8_9EURO|nr:hypothetical protein BO71DRAFT_179577 [Aspergillus ellipticus CBS 707.79]
MIGLHEAKACMHCPMTRPRKCSSSSVTNPRQEPSSSAFIHRRDSRRIPILSSPDANRGPQPYMIRLPTRAGALADPQPWNPAMRASAYVVSCGDGMRMTKQNHSDLSRFLEIFIT